MGKRSDVLCYFCGRKIKSGVKASTRNVIVKHGQPPSLIHPNGTPPVVRVDWQHRNDPSCRFKTGWERRKKWFENWIKFWGELGSELDR